MNGDDYEPPPNCRCSPAPFSAHHDTVVEMACDRHGQVRTFYLSAGAELLLEQCPMRDCDFLLTIRSVADLEP